MEKKEKTYIETMADDVMQLFRDAEETLIRFGKNRFNEGCTNKEFIGLIVDVDTYKDFVTEILPNHEATWQKFRDRGARPIARGTQPIGVGEYLAKADESFAKVFAKELPNPRCFFVFILGPFTAHITILDVDASRVKILGQVIKE